jgi:hypothetical protein
MARDSTPLDAAGKQGAPLVTAARGMLAGMAASAMIWLAACSSAVPGGAGPLASAGAGHSKEPAAAVRASAGVPLCAAAHRVDRVVVILTSTPPASRFHEILPRGITISDASRVRALNTAVCALPPMPPGLHCPADSGGAFRLLFVAGTRGFPPVRIQVSGCRGVSGVGSARWWSRSPQFGRLLIQTLGGRGVPIPEKSSVPIPEKSSVPIPEKSSVPIAGKPSVPTP